MSEIIFNVGDYFCASSAVLPSFSVITSFSMIIAAKQKGL